MVYDHERKYSGGNRKMIQQVKVVNITGNQCRTENGKILFTAGNKNINAGDYVWTDGKIVFGNEQTGGGSTITSTPKGIPIALVDESGIAYIDTKLKIQKLDKNNKIIGLVNDANKAYAMTRSTIYNLQNRQEIKIEEDVKSIIDAEIDENGDLYMLANGSYRYDATNVKIKFPSFVYVPGIEIPWSYTEERVLDAEAGSAEKPIEINEPIKIYKNGTLFQKIGIDQYVQEASKELDAFIKTLGFKKQNEVGGIIYPPNRLPPAEQTRKANFFLISAKINKKGEYKISFDLTCEKMVFPWVEHSCYKSHDGNTSVKSYLVNICKAVLTFEISNKTAEITNKNFSSEFKYSALTGELKKVEAEELHKLKIGQGIGESKYGIWEVYASSRWQMGDIIEAYKVECLIFPSYIENFKAPGLADEIFLSAFNASEYTKKGGTPVVKKTPNEDIACKVPIDTQGAYIQYRSSQKGKADVYTSAGEKILSGLEDRSLATSKYNACLCPAGGNVYLFSIKGGSIYKIQNKKAEKITESWNFRLCKQKNIKKIKKKITAIGN